MQPDYNTLYDYTDIVQGSTPRKCALDLLTGPHPTGAPPGTVTMHRIVVLADGQSQMSVVQAEFANPPGPGQFGTP